jgi:hypothetical protein
MTTYKQLQERINMAKAKMGDVIKDFQDSDAPQFKGKSDEKRRQMAIAAKLSNEEVEELDELSNSTMGSYTKKAAADFDARKPKMGYDGQLKKMQNRKVGVNRALDKMYGEEVEQTDEGYHVMRNGQSISYHQDKESADKRASASNMRGGSNATVVKDERGVKEELKGDQHKIDANKNGKVDGHDFKLLRAKKK